MARGCTTVQAVNDSVELFKETYDAALDKNTYEIQFCKLICASLVHWLTSQRAAVFTQGAAAARMKGRKFDGPPGRGVWIALWAMSINSALRACLPALTVILSRRRRILVHAAFESKGIKQQSAGRNRFAKFILIFRQGSPQPSGPRGPSNLRTLRLQAGQS